MRTQNDHYNKGLLFKAISILISIFLSGCASASIISYTRSGYIGIIHPIGLIIGFGIVWYCWIEAKRKNRNYWRWMILGFVFGFWTLLILVYLKDIPADETKEQE